MSTRALTVTAALSAQRDGTPYVDVRSRAEYASGHPAGAINVPLLDGDEDTGEMVANADFVRVMKATFATDTAVLVGCQSGGRSARAAQMLEVFGFTSVSDILGGYAGWVSAGLPVETTSPPNRAYADLLAKADAAEET